MKFYFKLYVKTWENETFYYYYESTSISALISYLSDLGFDMGSIIGIKRVSRLPKVAVVSRGCYE